MGELKSNSLEKFVQQQTQSLCDLWNKCDGEQYSLLPVVSMSEKVRNEAYFSNLLGWMGEQLNRPHMNAIERKAFSVELLLRVKQAGKIILNYTDEQMGCLEKLGITRSAETFYHQAREFDPFISLESIFQASRNVWTSNYLQVLLGLPVELTPSIFAYSMLYPVTDNFLDDPVRGKEEKYMFNKRFTDWLKGDYTDPQCWAEEDVLNLVNMIERQYPREQFQQVYEGLLAIHRAQIRSLKMARPDRDVTLSEIAAMTFEKGGTSVLADGILAAGELSNEEMEIIFNYGAFAQLMDDQEDAINDLTEGSVTLFTEAVRNHETDQLMNRVFYFANNILKGLQNFNNPEAVPLKQMSIKGIDLLLIDGILRTERIYPRGFLRKMEEHFPFRFEYAKKVRNEIRRKGFSSQQLIELLIQPEKTKGPGNIRKKELYEPVLMTSETR